jgi:hypothetical protein
MGIGDGSQGSTTRDRVTTVFALNFFTYLPESQI